MPTDYFSENGLTDKQVLGCALNEDMIDAFTRTAHRLTPEHFLEGKPRNTAKIIWGLLDANEKLGLLPIVHEAKALGVIGAVGGSAELAELGYMAPFTTEMLERCVTDIEGRYRAERLGEICEDYRNRSQDEPINSLVAGLTSDAAELVSDDTGDLTTPAGRLQTTVDNLFSNQVEPVRTGYAPIDGLIGGMYPGRLHILGGRPSSGKTALAIGIADHACRQNKSVALFSFEMTQDEILRRLMALRGHIDLQLLETQKIPAALASKVTTAAAEIHDYKLHIFAGRSGGLATINGVCRQIKQLHGLDLVVVDYLQLMTAELAQNREREIAAISGGLKTAALELDVPILALSQLKRPGEQRIDSPPTSSDLRESGAQEQDADLVWLVWRPNKNTQEPDNIAEIIVDKNRHGPTGRVRLSWIGNYAQFA